MSQSGIIWIDDCEILRETDMAFQIHYPEAGWTEWFPKSQLTEPDTLGIGVCNVGFTEWILKQKDIDY